MTSWWRAHRVRTRLTLWYLVTVLVVLGVYLVMVRTLVGHTAMTALDRQLRRDFQWTAASVYQAADGSFTWSQSEAFALDDAIPWVQVWDADAGRLLFRNGEARRRPVPGSQRLAAGPDNAIASVFADATPIRILTRRGRIDDTMLVIQVGRSEVPARQGLRRLMAILLLGLPVAVAIAGAGGYVVARRALAPIERMTERAHLITADRLGERLPVQDPDDEMGRLAGVFNETLAHLEASFARMHRFTADVSHELRTPLTAIRSVGEVALRGSRNPPAYRAVIGSMLEEVDRLATLVDRLLALSRAETAAPPLRDEPLDVSAFAAEAVAHLGVLAEERRQVMTLDAPVGTQAVCDPVVLRQALINLVDNAIKFSPEGGAIEVTVAEAGPFVHVDVRDSGPGVAVEHRDRIFERFYRAGPHAEGVATGVGLGLSIARRGIEMSGGRLTLESSGPEGSTFRVSLPARRA